MAHKNWTEINNYFLGHDAVSYADLSKKFGIPVGTIKYQAAKEKWQEKRKILLHVVHKKLEEEMTINMVERNRQQADFGRMLQGQAAKSMAHKKFEPKSAHQIHQWIKTGVALERDALGMNTNTNAYAVFKTKDEFISFVTRIVEVATGGKQIQQSNTTPSENPKDNLLPDGTSSAPTNNTPTKQKE